MLTLRDPQSSKTHAIPPEGATIGREGGRADILVRNPSVSKEHARLFSAEGAWWLEDLGSANGTYVNNGRIAEPTQLTAGLIFALSSYKFEVTSIGEEHQPEATRRGPGAGASASPGAGNRPSGRAIQPTEKGPAFDPIAVARAKPQSAPPPTPVPRSNPQIAPPRTRSAAARPAAVAPHAETGADEAEAFAATSAALPRSRSGVRPPTDDSESEAEPSQPSRRSGEQPMSGDSAMDGLSTTNVMRELPRAIAYYMATVPKLLFNPLGTIRQSIEDQRFPAMRGVPLIGWALPGLAAFGAVGLLSTLIVVIVGTIRGAGFAFGALIGGIIFTVAGGVIGGLVTAFIYHPVMEFIIRILKGQSDEKSRTNYLIIFLAAFVLFAIPTGVNTLIVAFVMLIPVAPVAALLPILPAVLQLGATLILVALAYHWFKFFRVHKLIPTIIMVLGALAVLGTVWGMIGSVRVAIASIGSGGSGRVVMSEAEARAAAAKAFESADVKRAVNDGKKATAAAAAAAAESEKVAAATPVQKPATDRPAAEARVAEVPAHDSPPPAPPPPASETAAAHTATAPPPAAETGTPAADATAGTTAYQRYAQRRDQIERMIAADPTLLTRNDEVLGLYKKIHTLQASIRKGKGGKDDIVTQRLIEAETFERTGKLVDDLYQRLTH
jgi:hypothetical protein